MKEITAYQSDDGKFVGTYEEVLEYEKGTTERKCLINRITSQFRCYDWEVALSDDESLLKFLQNPDVKELFHLLND